MDAKYKKAKSSTGHKMNKLEQTLAQDREVITAFNVLQALWKAKGRKPMEMVVEIGGTQNDGNKDAVRLTVRVTGEEIN